MASQDDARELALEELRWGRLVDVHAPDPVTGLSELQLADVPAGPALPEELRAETRVLTGLTRVVLDDAPGSAGYAHALASLGGGLLAPGPEGELPRTAVLVLEFNQPVDPASVGPESVRILLDDPHSLPIPARVFVDPLHPDRVVVDPSVGEVDVLRDGGVLQPNPAGLPRRQSFTLELPVRRDPALGVPKALRASSGARLAAPSAGSPDRIRVRLRVGPVGTYSADGGDTTPPEVLGVQKGRLTNVNQVGASTFTVDFGFNTVFCAQTPVVGDLVRTSTHLATVTVPGPAPVAGKLTGVTVQVIAGNPATFAAGRAFFGSAFDAGAGDVPECFIQFSPFPAAPPNQGVDPGALVAFRFTEPVSEDSAQPFDSFTVTRVFSPSVPGDYVVGDVSDAEGGSLLFFSPALPLAHQQAVLDDYFATLTPDITDLAGNPLAPFGTVAFGLDPAAPTESNGGLVLRFDSADEDGDGLPELRGQLLFDFSAGTLRGRPVTRFSSPIDSTQAVPALMGSFPQGVQTPLNPLGARLMKVWRYFDAGFSSTDEALHNLDVERLNWAPNGGQTIFDVYDEFEMSLSHSNRLPDEAVSPVSLLPLFPNSGLTGTSFDGNVLSGPTSGASVVHPRALGYQINPIDTFAGMSGTVLHPYPLNTGPNPASYQYFTWRDTAVQELGAPNGKGIDTQIMANAGLVPPQAVGQVATQGNVPSIGLPLLMDFKCFPDDTALGLNSLAVSLAINSSSRPNFRAFSAGGFNTAGQPVVKDPDLEAVPSGGFNPLSVPPGQTTSGTDNVFHRGQIDFVTRVSRLHSIWFDSGAFSPDYQNPVIDVEAGDMPPGTQVLLDFRGADMVVANADGAPYLDAGVLDAYGDQVDADGSGVPGDPAAKNSAVTFTGGDSSWKSDMNAIDGSRFFQVRVTFVGDTVTNLGAEIDSLGFVFLD